MSVESTAFEATAIICKSPLPSRSKQQTKEEKQKKHNDIFSLIFCSFAIFLCLVASVIVLLYNYEAAPNIMSRLLLFSCFFIAAISISYMAARSPAIMSERQQTTQETLKIMRLYNKMCPNARDEVVAKLVLSLKTTASPSEAGNFDDIIRAFEIIKRPHKVKEGEKE